MTPLPPPSGPDHHVDSHLDRHLDRRRALGLATGALLGGALAGAGAGPATAATAWTTFPVLTANFGRVADPRNNGRYETSMANVRRDVEVGGRTARSFVGFQEIGEGDKSPDLERRLVAKYFDAGFTRLFLNPSGNPSYRVPIVVPTPFEVVSHKAVKAHGGVENVSPPRWISEVVVRLKSDPVLRFAVLNTHYIAGAFSGHPERRTYWNAHFELHRQRVAAYHDRGYPVIWTGDVNNRAMGRTHPLEKKVFDGIDQVRWIPGTNGTQLDLVRRQTVDLTIEAVHDAKVAVMRVRRA